MHAVVLTALLLAQPGGIAYKGQMREPHPLAPSLPQLTEKEEDDFTKIIDRFIEYDIGNLKGTAGQKALAEFKALGPEATFVLIDGLNRAANMEGSCPAVLIAKKLSVIFGGSKDKVMLDYARDMIGLGVTAKRHQVVLKDLRLACTLRKSALERVELAGGKQPGPGPAPAPKEKSLQTMTVSQLATAASKEKGELLQKVLVELSSRKGDQVVYTLGQVAARDDKEAAALARSLLIEQLFSATGADLKSWLKSGSAVVRAAAAQVIGDRGFRFTDELIAALLDADENVRQAARAALVKLAGDAADHGPVMAASPAQRQEAAQRWRGHFQKKQ